jgi:hypothetical protein
MSVIREAQMIIGILEDGQLAHDFSEELQSALAELKEHAGPKGKAKGSVTLHLDLTVEGGTVTINADLKSKRPKSGRAASVLFVLDDGTLSTEHPRQANLFGPRDAGLGAPRVSADQ